MVQCLQRYDWVKLLRSHLPEGKGVMGAWAKLASRAAFRKGNAYYCGFSNPVEPGMWAGGVVGLKSILGAKKRHQALQTMERLQELGFISYELDPATKKLTYQILDWVVKCSGAECMDGAVYTTDGYGFLCLPRNITQRLAAINYQFEEADAWLDLWCHTVSNDRRNAFSFLAPAVQYGKYGALLTLETLGQRWGWEKTKVWRFFQKHGDVFSLYRLPGAYGCLIFNKLYPSGTEVSLPSQDAVVRILEEIRILAKNTRKRGTDHEHMSRMVAWYSRQVLDSQGNIGLSCGENCRVALTDPILLRAYFSLCRICKKCGYDCGRVSICSLSQADPNTIRGPCGSMDLNSYAKEYFTYEQTG